MKKPICWLFAISLLVNALLISCFVGHYAHHGSKTWMHQHDSRPSISSLNLPEDKKAMVGDAMKAFREDSAERFDTIRVKRQEIVDILTAPEFDEAAFKAKSRELSELFTGGKQAMADRMAAIARDLSQEERQELAKFMRRPPPAPMGGPMLDEKMK